MLTPTDIHNKDLKRTWRGYDIDETDEFLDQIVNDYEKLYRENTKLKDELDLVTKDVDRYKQLERNLQDTLMVAQRTAEEVITAARQKADAMKSAAENECNNLRERTEMETKRKIDESAAKVRSIVDEYDRLVREKNKFLSMVRATLSTELAAIDGAIGRMPHPEYEEAAPPVANIKTEPQEEEANKNGDEQNETENESSEQSQ